MSSRTPFLIAVLIGLLVPVLPPFASAAQEPGSPVRVAVANVREGAVAVVPADQDDDTDRRAFARRLHERPGPLADVVLLQEVRGSAGRVARALNDHPRARAAGVRYRVEVRPRTRVDQGGCDGPRTGRFAVLRTSAVLVNTSTVRSVRQTGSIRTWGRWGAMGRAAARVPGGCTEHPWADLVVQHPGTTATRALVVSPHVAPVGGRLKNRAMTRLQRETSQLRALVHPDVTAVGGDMNLNRCTQPFRTPEREDCTVRAGHRAFLADGYADAMRTSARTGPTGVVGLERRIDFLYTDARIADAWHDRCYLAWLATTPACDPGVSVFSSAASFQACKRRSVHVGRPGPSCPAPRLDRFYSDHPLLLATLR